MRFTQALSLSFLLVGSAQATTSSWSDIVASDNKLAKQSSQTGRWLDLNHETLLEKLATAPSDITKSGLQRSPVLFVNLPLPDGSFARVQVEASSIMEQGLADKYPQIKTWKVKGIDNKVLSGRMGYSSSGFHAMLSLTTGETVLIDAKTVDGSNVYLSHKRESHDSSTHKCSLKHINDVLGDTENKAQRSLLKSANTLRTYRLALATTGEYTQNFGSAEKAIEAVAKTISRINEIYERDLSIKLQLVSENDQLIYTDPDNDPYANGDEDKMSDQNQVNITSVIGNNNYDVGHVFGTGNGGIAVYGGACRSTIKAIGATSVEDPASDVFYIDYVAHELGHQFGADHSFNGIRSSCSQRNASTAVEPGSGSTIMAYAGICGTDNLQKNSDAVFHYGSIQEIMTYSRNGKGATCGTEVSLGNNVPVATAAGDKTIPARTPFVLNGSATDADSDTLTYAWDQVDKGTQAYVDVDNGDNPIIRSYLPSENSERMIPKLSDLIANTTTKGDMLPTTTRSLNFKFVVRDGKGAIGEDDLVLNVYDTGSAFAITSKVSEESLKKDDIVDVTWNVAGTDAGRINCSKVDISLSNDGKTFSTLKTNLQNDGSDTITLANDISSTSSVYVKVACSDNIFFAVAPLAGFLEGETPSTTSTAPSSTDSSGGGGAFFPYSLFLLSLLVGFISYRRTTKVLK